MARTSEQFLTAWNNASWYTKFHNKPVWIVPIEDGYNLSSAKPHPDDLPTGTMAILVDKEMFSIDEVKSTEKPHAIC